PRGSLDGAARGGLPPDGRSGGSPRFDRRRRLVRGGTPIAIDGEELPLYALVGVMNERAGAYGIGRIDMIENRAVGIKSRELYEAPAALALIAAHRALEELVLTKGELEAKRELEPKWAKLVYD